MGTNIFSSCIHAYFNVENPNINIYYNIIYNTINTYIL